MIVRSYCTWMHDGWYSHRDLDARFHNRWIGRGRPIPWPPRSPDMTPLDFFMWGFVKDRVYSTKVGDIVVLKRRITEVIGTITPEMLRNTWREIEYGLDIVRV